MVSIYRNITVMATHHFICMYFKDTVFLESKDNEPTIIIFL